MELASPMGLGTNQWRDGTKQLPGLQECASAAFAAGAMMLDTAEVYTGGASERAVGEVVRSCDAHHGAVVSTKHIPLPWHVNAKKALGKSLHASLKRLQLPHVDLYYMHMANTAIRPLEAYADALADAVDAGLVRTVGVSNFSENQMRQFAKGLAKRGVPLAALQVEFSLLRRTPETTGLLQACKDLGVTFVAWAPLGGGKGRLTSAAFDALKVGRPVPGLSPSAAALLQEVGAVANEHGTTVEAVAIAWTIAKGAVALVGTRKGAHVTAAACALELKLTQADMDRLDTAALDNDGMYVSMLDKNLLTRFLARRVMVPLLQDPLPSKL